MFTRHVCPSAILYGNNIGEGRRIPFHGDPVQPHPAALPPTRTGSLPSSSGLWLPTASGPKRHDSGSATSMTHVLPSIQTRLSPFTAT